MSTDFDVELLEIGKKYNRNWLFKDISFSLKEKKKLALVGTNGSGKSTLLRIIAGQTSPSIGKIRYKEAGENIPLDQAYQHISWMGPYLEVFPELTLEELFKLHFRFKSPLLSSVEEIIDKLNLTGDKHKMLNYYSSGMLQRAKVGMALFSDSEVLFLDEPTSNMDKKNAQLILELIENHLGDRLFVLASNMEREYESFPHKLQLGIS
ncbi:MAG: ATP-binding cassette domain-containing protein [Bacteroidota bacterium]